MPEEKSGSGNPIHRHASVPGDGEVAHADDARIVAHVERCCGPVGTVFHEIVSERVHVDVHIVPPTAERPFVVLVTSGMSARPMTMPPALPDAGAWTFAELCVLLPPSWPLAQELLKDERNYWPIRVLKTLARLPHLYATWLGWGHSVPNGDPPEPYAPGTRLSGVVVLPPFALGTAFFEVPGDPPMHLFQLVPVTTEEMELKLAQGTDALLDRLDALDPSPYGPIDPRRASAV